MTPENTAPETHPSDIETTSEGRGRACLEVVFTQFRIIQFHLIRATAQLQTCTHTSRRVVVIERLHPLCAELTGNQSCVRHCSLRTAKKFT